MTSFILSFALWAVLHSLTAAQWMKDLFASWLGDRLYQGIYRLGYVIVSVVTFVPVLLLYWRLPDRVLWAVPAPWLWLFIAVQLLGLAGLLLSLWQTRALAFVGLQQLIDYLESRPQPARSGLGEELFVGGLYRFMRHPLYTFSMLILWFVPIMTRNFLILTALSTLYFVLGSMLEERRLQGDFGEPYADYRRRVSRFIPGPRTVTRAFRPQNRPPEQSVD